MTEKNKTLEADTPGSPVPPAKGPKMTVGIMDWQREINGCLHGVFNGDGPGTVSGRFSAKALSGKVLLVGEDKREWARATSIRLKAQEGSTFTLFNVIIGNSFHWERKEDQIFQGNLILRSREDGTIVAINEIHLEDYLQSVISSEMSGGAPLEFLKAHAILSRSWLLSALERREIKASTPLENAFEKDDELVRWYEQEEHDLYDVCADDHCQRYQGITKIVPGHAGEAVRDTNGVVITHLNKICDARYSKACGGITEAFETAWDDGPVPYLASISDASFFHPPIRTEEEATSWILSEPEAYCNTREAGILEKVLPDFDRETTSFFRWKIEYTRGELEQILREKSGFDFGTLKEIEPLSRGPSGRISRLRIVGSGKTVIVGKELEIRRWLSRTHLYSSAFVVSKTYGAQGEIKTFILHGAGWGHGVGLCQIGAAVMATRGFTAEMILSHYFTDTQIRKVY